MLYEIGKWIIIDSRHDWLHDADDLRIYAIQAEGFWIDSGGGMRDSSNAAKFFIHSHSILSLSKIG
jgi:hypothetical protein